MMFPPRTMLVETAPGSARESLSAYGKQWGMRTIIPFDIHTFLSFLPGVDAVLAALRETFHPVCRSVDDYKSFTMRSCAAVVFLPGSPAGRRFATM
ncbi:hypothetical protein [Burkholderia cepacia]|uniref:hypothetical protein n=1 Tax=Burkholderia cepacia TaxID=292 RepID=UPI001589AAE2|nr:hypothetical protein [Burkholderia cepacia]